MLSVANILGHSFTQKELQLNQLKHKHFASQFQFATQFIMTKSNLYAIWSNMKPLASPKDDCQPVTAAFGNDQFTFRMNDNGKNITNEPKDHFAVKLLNDFKVNIKNHSKKILKNYHNKLQIEMIPISLNVMILKRYLKMAILFTLIYR